VAWRPAPSIRLETQISYVTV